MFLCFVSCVLRNSLASPQLISVAFLVNNSVSSNVRGATPEIELDVKMVASAPGKDNERKEDEQIHPARPTDVSGDIEKASRTPEPHPLDHIESHISHHELHGVVSQHVEINAAQYERFSEQRKLIITAVLSLCGFLAPISSTSVLSAVPEVAAEYRTTGSIINLSNALYLISMGLSPCLWGPLSQVYGRRWVCRLERLAQLSLTTISDMHHNRRTLLRFLNQHSSRPKSGIFFCLSHLDRFSRDFLSCCWYFLPWRHIHTYKTCDSAGPLPFRHTGRSSIWTFYWRNHRDFQDLERDILAPKCSGRIGHSFGFLPAARDHSGKEDRRAITPELQREISDYRRIGQSK